MNTQRGFTLVETVVVSALVAVLAGGLLGFYNFNARQLRSGTTEALLQQYYETAADQIGRSARTAHAVLNNGAGEVFVDRGTYAAGNATQILMYDEFATVFAGYRSRNGILQERNTAGNWINFSVGSEDLQVAGGAPFVLGDTVGTGRTMVTLQFAVHRAVAGGGDTLRPRGDAFSCRN